jgi:uncharacterized MAPEG superfamily protein
MGVHTPVELQLLVVAVIVGIVQIAWAAAAGAGGDRDLAYLSGPRDEPRPVGTVAGRLDRALRNFLETFPLFAAAVLACVASGRTGGSLTVYGAGVYVAARAVYVPLYAVGVPMLRTLVWGVSLVGIIMVIVAFFR